MKFNRVKSINLHRYISSILMCICYVTGFAKDLITHKCNYKSPSFEIFNFILLSQSLFRAPAPSMDTSTFL